MHTPQVWWYGTDTTGAPVELTDAAGKTVWRAQRLAWGNLTDEAWLAEGADNCLRLPGQYEDRETGLFYNLHRYYDPRHGRYITPDPVGLAGGINLYAYVPDPLKYIDPLGLCKVDNARARQAQMLQDDVGYNISPKSWDQFPAIGRDGTFVTDKEGALKHFSNIQSGEITISKYLAATIEKDMGLYPGSLSDGFKIRKIDGISNMQPRSPLSGNDYFLGPGQHLPGGAPEMVINSVPTTTPVTIRVNAN
ncbi:RHS repeat-associated core domain-containing protein [Enterobacter chengduensis]|uniref:RHS repeat-associated core domain-containing protein n=1 Tax=Enterobacter chengduensis TaxID=2494701 RepID=UPI002E198CC8|nr:RHS repeat-associated core domain-containing protein [Enterobacter chengduensis]